MEWQTFVANETIPSARRPFAYRGKVPEKHAPIVFRGNQHLPTIGKHDVSDAADYLRQRCAFQTGRDVPKSQIVAYASGCER